VTDRFVASLQAAVNKGVGRHSVSLPVDAGRRITREPRQDWQPNRVRDWQPTTSRGETTWQMNKLIRILTNF
jgi:hypothetical protein